MEKLYSALHRFFLGEAPSHCPPRWLWILWFIIILARLPSLTYSLDEDSIWCLVTKIDQPWSVTLGFKDAYTLNHIVNSVLAKILIKSTNHHFVEFTYRIPSILAGMLAMPLGYGVMMRIAGPIPAVIFGVAVAILPAVNLHATSARGYALLFFFTIWTLGLMPGIAGRVRPVRLGIAYFLLASSHGLGIITTCCFAVAGCFLGPKPPRFKPILHNGLLCLPGLLFNIPMLLSMRMEKAKMALESDVETLAMAAFIPKWFEYQFGSALFPGLSVIFAIIMIIGVIKILKQTPMAGIALIFLMCSIPASYIAAKTYWCKEWYSMGCLAFWLWAFCVGAETVFSLRSFSFIKKQIFVRALIILGALMLPNLYEYLRYPRQDYTGVFKTFFQKIPNNPLIGCTADVGITGLSYYARQYNLEFQTFNENKHIPENLWPKVLLQPAIISVKGSLSIEDEKRLRASSNSVKNFKGTGWDVLLYFMKVDSAFYLHKHGRGGETK